MKSNWKKYIDQRKKDIMAFVFEIDGVDNMSTQIANIKLNLNIDHFRSADCKQVYETMEQSFKNYYVLVCQLIK